MQWSGVGGLSLKDLCLAVDMCLCTEVKNAQDWEAQTNSDFRLEHMGRGGLNMESYEE